MASSADDVQPLLAFDAAFAIDDVTNSTMHSKQGVIALLNGRAVDLLRLVDRSVIRSPQLQASLSVVSMAWQESPQDNIARLALSSAAANLSILALSSQLQEPLRNSELHRLTLRGLLPEQCKGLTVDKVSIINYRGRKLTVVVDDRCIVQLSVNETKPWEIIYVLPCPERIIHTWVCNSIISIIDADSSVLLHDIADGHILAVIKRDKNRWTVCRLTTDYINAVLQNDEGELFCCNLDSYFKKNRLLLTQPHSSAGDHWYSCLHFSNSKHTMSDAATQSVRKAKTLYKIPVPGECLSFAVLAEQIAALSLCEKVIFSCFDLRSGDLQSIRLEHNELVVMSPSEGIPHLLLRERDVLAIKIGPYQKIASKVPVGKSLLDHIMETNGWKMAPVSIDALKEATQMRNIEAVQSFLKTRTSLVEDILAKSSTSKELADICSLLHTASETYIKHSTTRAFACQLTEASVFYLKEQTRKCNVSLNNALLKQDARGQELLEQLLEFLSDHTMALSALLSNVKENKESSKWEVAKKSISLNKDLVKKWNSMSSKEIIGDGILMGQISLLQNFLSQNNRSAEASWDNIVKVGLSCVLDELDNRSWTSACQLLKNLGFGVFEKLYQIAKYTTNSSLRQYLIGELRSEGRFTDLETRAIKFAEEISQLYPCESFQASLCERARGTQSPQQDDPFRLLRYCGEIGIPSPSSTTSPFYSQIMLNWLEQWLPFQNNLVIERTLIDPDKQDRLKEIPAVEIWSYLCRHSLLTELTEWIRVQYCSQLASRVYQACPISEEMLEWLSVCPAIMQEKIKDELAGYGVFVKDDRFDSQKRVARLRNAGALLDVQRRFGFISLESFCTYCLKNNLLEVLFFLFYHHRVTDAELRSLSSSLHGKDILLLQMMHSFVDLATNGVSAARIIQLCLTSSRYLARHPYLTLTDLLDKQMMDSAMCMLMYMSPFLAESDVSVPDVQMEKLKEHPLLKQLLVKESEGNLPAPLTVYKLLQKWGRFSCNRLFGWRMSEEMPDQGALKDAPHFSDPDLVSQYGHREKLNFLHYLKQGRPSFALAVFLATELSGSNGTISTTRMESCVKQATYLAIKYCHKSHITSACVAFCEMLNEDTSLLKLLLNTTQLISDFHAQEALKERRAAHFDTESLVLPLVFGKKSAAKAVLDELQRAVQYQIDRGQQPRTSVECGLKWSVVVNFCKLYNLPPSTKYLEQCAAENNWISFLVIAQVFGYHSHQLLPLVNSFTDDSMREHIQCVVENLMNPASLSSPAKAPVDILAREKRAQLYARMGLINKKRTDVGSFVSSSEDETKLQTDIVVNPPPSVPERVLNTEHVPNDIFAVLFMANNCPQPWRLLNSYCILLENPVLAVLSACHQESDPLECLCAWLVASLPDAAEIGKKIFDVSTGTLISRLSFYDIVKLMMEKQRFLLLRTGFMIFFTATPLMTLLSFYEDVTKQDFSAAGLRLAAFKDSIIKLRQSASKDSPLTISETTSLAWHLVKCHLRSVNSYLTEKMLQLLDSANLSLVFAEQGADFGTAYKIYKVAYDEKISGIDCTHLMSRTAEFIRVCEGLIGDLELRKAFQLARQVAGLADLDLNAITLRELKTNLDKAVFSTSWHVVQGRKDFWLQCHNKFVESDITPSVAAQYFKDRMEISAYAEERVALCEHTAYWLRQDHTAVESGELDQLQKRIWENKIELEMGKLRSLKKQDSTSGLADQKESLRIDKTQFLLSNFDYVTFIAFTGHPDQKLQTVLETLIGQCLDQCRLQEACLLALEYKCATQDLIIIMACINLALENIFTDTLDDYLLKLTVSPAQGRRKPMNTASQGFLLVHGSSSNLLQLKGDQPLTMSRNLKTMETLAQHCKSGVLACDKIVICYKIALAFGQPYRDIVLQSEYSLIKQLLHAQIENKYSLAQEYINTSTLSDSDVASFLSRSVINRLLAQEDQAPALTDEESSYPISEFKHLVKLFKDPAVFGDYLLQEAGNLDVEDISKKLRVKVQLLIFAHDCHSCAYNMEGISNVLRACRGCALQLNQVSEFTLMVQLLTGIGRFSEMTYIFETLKQNHQFELLFKKGVAKEDKLRLAVLDYLRRFCPGDNDSYRIVSSHFTMFREIAQLLEESAFKRLESIPARLNESNASQLIEAQKNLTDAAEIYIEGDCLRHAQVCVKKARLISLQIQLLPNDIQVINLDSLQVKDFLIKHDKFHETFIVAEAYGKSEWASALCDHVLIQGDQKYLSDFKRTLSLTNSLISDVVQRFMMKVDPRLQQTNVHLRKFVMNCKDVVMRYKLAEQLKLQDVMNDMLNSEGGVSGSYIKDVCRISI